MGSYRYQQNPFSQAVFLVIFLKSIKKRLGQIEPSALNTFAKTVRQGFWEFCKYLLGQNCLKPEAKRAFSQGLCFVFSVVIWVSIDVN